VINFAVIFVIYFPSYTTQWCKDWVIQQLTKLHEPLGAIFRLIKYGIVQGTSMWLPMGSRGLQYASYKICYIKNVN